MKKTVVLLLMICLCFGTVTTYSYDFFATDSLLQQTNLFEYCALENGALQCNTQRSAAIIASIDATLEPFFHELQALPEYAISQYYTSIASTLPVLTKKIIATSNEKEQFAYSYTKAILNDMLSYLKFQQQFVRVDRYTARGIEKPFEQIRREVVAKLLEVGGVHFVQRPYVGSGVAISTASDDWEHYAVHTPVSIRDDLDRYLLQQLAQETAKISIPAEIRATWGPIALFKNNTDLHQLGYHVVSHRKRTNKDAEYRRFNIERAMKLVGSVRVINPGESISFLQESQFDPVRESLYKYGKIIFLDEEVDDYGGGLCGGSTALYQGIILNTGLSVTSRNHTKWYSGLYTAELNGENITIPGLDSTIYYPNLDLQFTNISDRPIVLVSNFNGEYGEIEEIFTLGELDLRGAVSFDTSRAKSYTIQQKDGASRSTNGRCYKWIINGTPQVRCYKEVF